MSLSNQTDINNLNKKEIKLVLQIVKNLTIDSSTSIFDIKKSAKEIFEGFDQFKIMVKDYDVFKFK